MTIKKFASAGGKGSSEFLDLSHTSKSMTLVSLMIAKFAPEPGRGAQANFAIGTLGLPMIVPELCARQQSKH